MLDLAAVRLAFPTLTNLVPLGSPSGQKEVLQAEFANESVVLKLIKKNPQEQSRTEREISAAVKLACSYVPRVFELGQRVGARWRPDATLTSSQSTATPSEISEPSSTACAGS